MRSPWIQVVPKSNGIGPYKRQKKRPRGEDYVKTQAEIGLVLGEASKNSLEHSDEWGPTNTFILNCQLPELWENKLLLF